MKRLIAALIVIAIAALLVLHGKRAGGNLPGSFAPPSVRSLADIDAAEVSYGNDRVVVQGVVSPESQGGWAGQSDDYEVHCFTFAAWRRLGGPGAERDLTILRAVPPDADYWGDFPKHAIRRLSVLLSTDGTRAIFAEALPVDSPDQELQAIAARLQRPVIFPTDRFGDLTLDRSVGQFEGEAIWNGKTIQIVFPVKDERPDKDALRTAESLWSDQARWKARLEDFAVKQLLQLKNKTWLEEGESELTAAEFVARMTLTSISIESDGEFSFWYDDGDLFWGHVIMVSGDMKDGPTDAGIHG